MPILTLKDAAEYVKTRRATRLLLAVLQTAKRIFTFTEERSNRVNRYVQVIDAYKKGTSVLEICNKYGCSKRTVYDYIHKAGITPRSFTPSEVKMAIVRDYKNGIPVTKIAELNNVSLRYVQKVAKEARLSRKKKANA